MSGNFKSIGGWDISSRKVDRGVVVMISNDSLSRFDIAMLTWWGKQEALQPEKAKQIPASVWAAAQAMQQGK